MSKAKKQKTSTQTTPIGPSQKKQSKLKSKQKTKIEKTWSRKEEKVGTKSHQRLLET